MQNIQAIDFPHRGHPNCAANGDLLNGDRQGIPLREMVSIDYLYVANWSLWIDMQILLRSIAHVVARKGV